MVGAGSVVKGITYEIVRSRAIVPAPAALLERILANGKAARVVARDMSGRMVIPDGKRNDQMFRVACALRRFGIDFNAIKEALRVINSEHCSPPMDDEELRTISASAMRYAPDAAACAIEGST